MLYIRRFHIFRGCDACHDVENHSTPLTRLPCLAVDSLRIITFYTIRPNWRSGNDLYIISTHGHARVPQLNRPFDQSIKTTKILQQIHAQTWTKTCSPHHVHISLSATRVNFSFHVTWKTNRARVPSQCAHRSECFFVCAAGLGQRKSCIALRARRCRMSGLMIWCLDRPAKTKCITSKRRLTRNAQRMHRLRLWNFAQAATGWASGSDEAAAFLLYRARNARDTGGCDANACDGAIRLLLAVRVFARSHPRPNARDRACRCDRNV